MRRRRRTESRRRTEYDAVCSLATIHYTFSVGGVVRTYLVQVSTLKMLPRLAFHILLQKCCIIFESMCVCVSAYVYCYRYAVLY